MDLQLKLQCLMAIVRWAIIKDLFYSMYFSPGQEQVDPWEADLLLFSGVWLGTDRDSLYNYQQSSQHI